MSRTIDERVVSMQFDNKNFEHNVQTSLGTIAKLKQSLNFKGASKGLENLGAAAKKVDMAPLGNAVQTVGLKFNGMYAMADQYLRNLETRVEQAARNIVRSFTTDPIKMGLSEYETQINAVQTILANTQSKGTTLDDVNAALDELNTYADKTIYNFTEMTRNIGTFTAAGTDLETSVNAIQGIANLAAISGSTSQQASTAMYQLSQALASGTVKLMDWNSVVNAGMGGQVFQDALKETARVHGVAIDDMIKKNGSFRETLQEEWLTSEILTETLQKFTLTTEGLTDAQIEQNKAMLKSKGYTDEQIEGIFELGDTATNAATKVKTFTQLMDTLKEAAQSGWTQTWEILIGDFEEAKELWTNVSDVFSKIIGDSAEARNAMLEGAMTSGWEKFTKELEKSGVTVDELETSIRKVAEGQGLDFDKIIKDSGSLEEAFQDGSLSVDLLKESLKGVQTIAEDIDFGKVKRELKNGMTGDDVKEIEKALKSLGYTLTGKDGKDYSDDGFFGTLTRDAIKEFQKANNLKVTGIVDEKTLAALDNATKKTKTLESSVWDLVNGVTELGGRQLLIDSLKDVFHGFVNILSPFKKAFRDVFPRTTSEQLYKLIEGFRNLTGSFRAWTESETGQTVIKALTLAFKGLLTIINIIKDVALKALSVGFKVLSKVFGFVIEKVAALASKFGDAALRLKEWIIENDAINKGFELMFKAVKKVVSIVKDWIKAFFKLPEVQRSIRKIKDAFSDAFSNIGDHLSGGLQRIKDFIERLKNMDSISLENIGDVFKDFKKSVVDYFLKVDFKGMFKKIKDAFKGFGSNVAKYLGIAGDKFDVIKEKLVAFVDFIRSKIPAAIAIGMGILLIRAVSKLGKAFEVLSNPLEGVKDFLDGIGKSFSNLVKAKGFEARTNGILNLAKSIAILAASVTVLTLLDQGKLWSAVAALTVLSGVMVALAFVTGKMNKIGDLKGSSLSMLSLSASLLILVSCLKGLEGLDGEKVWGNVLILGALAVGLAAITGVLGRLSPSLSKGSLTFIALAAGLKIMVGVLSDLDKMNFDNLGRSIVILLGVIGGLALVAAATRGISLGSTVGIIAMAIGLKMFSSTLEDIASLDGDKMISNLDSFIVVIGSLAAMMASTKLAGKSPASAGFGLLAMTLGLLVAVKAIEQLSEVEPGMLSRAAGTLGKLMLVFAGVMVLTRFAGKNALGAGITMLAMSASILILTGAIALLKNMEPDGLDRAIETIAKLSLVFAAVIMSTKLAQSCVGTLVVLTIAVGALSIAIAGLSLLDPEGIKRGTIALGAAIGMFALLVVASKFASKSFASLIVMTGAVVLLGGVIYLLHSLPIDGTIAIAASLSVLILSLSGACAILSVVPVTGALMGIASLAILIAGVGLIMAAISGLTKMFPNMNTFLEESIPTLKLIGSAIGSFFGGIVGGFAEGVTSSFGQIGTDLSTFMTNLKPFIDGAKNIDKASMEGVQSLVGVIKSITAASFLEGITSWVTGESSMTTFADELPTFGSALKSFSDNVKGISTTDVESAASVAATLASMASTIPNEGGLIAVFTGENSMSTFGTQLAAFGLGLKSFADNVKDIDTEAVTAAAGAASTLATMASTIPSEGGLISWFTGEQNMETFGTQLAGFGTGLKTFADKVSGIDETSLTSITNATAAAKGLSEFATSLPTEGGLFAWFTGDQNMETFGTQLAAFGGSLASFATKVSGIDETSLTSVNNATAAANALSEFAKSIPENGSVFSVFTGEQNMETFGKQLVAFGGSIVNFGTTVSSLDETSLSAITTATAAAKGLSEFAATIPDQGGIFKIFGSDSSMGTFGTNLIAFGVSLKDFSDEVTGISSGSITTGISAAKSVSSFAGAIPEGGYDILKTFGGQMKTFGTNIKTFYDKVSGIDADKFSSITTSFSTFISALNGIPKDGFTELGSFGDSLGAIGKEGITAFIKAFEDSAPKLKTAGADMVSNLINGAKLKKSVLTRTLKLLADACVTAIKEKYSGFKEAGKYVVSGFSAGISANTFKAKASAAAMASAALAAAKLALLVKSPSRAFYEIGDYAGQGFVNALDDYQNISYKAGENVAEYARKGLSNAISKVSDLISSGIDTRPTIRPVLDLSDVASGVNAMNGMFSMGPSLDLLTNVGSISSMMNRGQNGSNDDVVSAIRDLGRSLDGRTGDTYNVNGVTYDDESTLHTAVRSIIKAAKIERRR